MLNVNVDVDVDVNVAEYLTLISHLNSLEAAHTVYIQIGSFSIFRE